MNSNKIYNQFSEEYDQWFERHENLYKSELLALQQAIPIGRKGLEVGVGTGRFAQALNIPYGVEPSRAMANLARKRGIEVVEGMAENLPFEAATFDFVLMVTVDCFLSDIPKAFSEIYRVLKPMGAIIIGMINKTSPIGQQYEKEKSHNKFYKEAHFHSVEEMTLLLINSGFINPQYWQTLERFNAEGIELPQSGFGKGSFVVIKALKNS